MDVCMENYMEFSQNIEQKASCFFDYVDPYSGILMNLSNPNKTYSEIAGCRAFLVDTSDYFIQKHGNFEMLMDPECGMNVYISSIFFGPSEKDEVMKLIEQ